MRRAAASALTAGGLAAAGLAYALAEAQWFALRTAIVPMLRPGEPPLTLLHISDLHLLARQRRKIAFIRSLGQARPDLVIATGDNLAAASAIPALFEALGPLLDSPGAFVFGGHDYFSPGLPNPVKYLRGDTRNHNEERVPDLPAEEVAAQLTEHGWHDLNNARAQVNVAGRTIALAGVADPHEGWDAFPARSEDEAGYRIGVVHAPYARVLRQFADDGAQLVLAGHTHGGQLCLPGIGTLVTNCDLDRGRARGLSGWPSQRPDEQVPGSGEPSLFLHVSAGLGAAPATPVRFACRPEATILTLVSEAT